MVDIFFDLWFMAYGARCMVEGCRVEGSKVEGCRAEGACMRCSLLSLKASSVDHAGTGIPRS